MNRTIEERILAAWYTGKPAHLLADQFGLSAKQLQTLWRKAKSRGDLPLGSRPTPQDDNEQATAHHDGRPKLADDDPLLQRLRRYHDAD